MKKRAGDILVLTLIVLMSGLTMMGVISGTIEQEIKTGKFNREYNELKIININNLQAGYGLLKQIEENGNDQSLRDFHALGENAMPVAIYESLEAQSRKTYEDIKD